MDKQPKTLELADFLDHLQGCAEAADELRRLHEVNAELLSACQLIDSLHPQNDSTTDWNVAFNKVHAAIAKATGEQQ